MASNTLAGIALVKTMSVVVRLVGGLVTEVVEGVDREVRARGSVVRLEGLLNSRKCGCGDHGEFRLIRVKRFTGGRGEDYSELFVR